VVALEEQDMLNLAEKAVKAALKRGADEAEAFLNQSLTNSVTIEIGQISKTSRIIDSGLGIRAIMKKAIGFSYTNVLEDAAIEETVLRAVSFARASKPDKDWNGLPPKKALPSVKGTYDPRIEDLHSEDLVKVASLMLDAAEGTDKRAFPIEGGAGTGVLSAAVANSNGVGAADEGTVVECSLAAIGREGSEVTPECVEFNFEREYDIDPEWVGREAARLAASALRAKRIETGTMTVVFTQFALQQLLYYTLMRAVSADYVQRNQSALKGRVGKMIGAECVTVHDDGLLEGGIRTGRFDGEGVPQQKTVLIEKGVLRGFVYDNYTAGKEGRASTGNGSRAGYLSTPSVDETNFHILNGGKSAEQLVSGLDKGLLVYSVQGAHTSNPVSCDFSVVATPAWLVKGGEVGHAVRAVMLAGNVFEVLKNVSEVADNSRKVGQLVAPWVAVENVKVIGK
jgi:PmbA protein